MLDIKNLKVNMEQKILESNNIVVVPHSGIDFDAIGSALGISLIAKKLKKNSCIVIDDPVYKIDPGVQIIINDVSKDFSITTSDRYLNSSSADDLFVLTDVNNSKLVTLNEYLTNREKIIIIDHHNESNSCVDAQLKCIDSTASSASEIVTRLLNAYKIRLCPQIANYLLAGIYLDTNKLTKGLSSNTTKAMSKLLEMGADMNSVTELFSEDFISDRRVQELISKTKFISFSIAMVAGEETIEYTKEELAKVADYLLKYKVDAAFAAGNIGDNIISISARSKGRVDVGSIMQEIQGGGSPFAAATKLTGCTVEEANKRLLKVIQPPCYLK